MSFQKELELYLSFEASVKNAMEKDLHRFSKHAWKILDPVPFLDNWHIELICDYLMAVTRGDIRRLIINIPPRYSKSSLVSIIWPVWEWITRPQQRWLFASYAALLSNYMSIKRRDLINSDWYQSRWGGVYTLKTDYNRQADYMNSRGGMMFSTSTWGTITGMGGNRLVIDDPTNPLEAISDSMREHVNSWFFNTFLPRLDDKKRGSIVLVQQRLNQNDLTGFLMDLGPEDYIGHKIVKNGWTLIRLPLVCEMTEEIRSPLTGKLIHEYKEGELLWPGREGLEQIAEKKRDMFVFESQYQQRPISKSGAIFQRSWLDNRYYEGRLPTNPDTWVMSVDASYKNSDNSDYVAIGIWAVKLPNMYLDHVVRERLSFPQTVEAIKQLLSAYPSVSAKLIEEGANGRAIIDTLYRDVGGIIPIIPRESKLARAQAVTPYFQSGNVWVRRDTWTHNYIRELLTFDGSPSSNTVKDDQVDMTTMAINYIQRTWGSLRSTETGNTGIIRYIGTGRR